MMALRTALVLSLLISTPALAQKKVVGWIEPAQLQAYAMQFPAKLDTGARTTSLNASSIKVFDKDGADYVRFSIKTAKGAPRTLELPLVREAVIKRHFTEAQRRPVVLMDICIGGLVKRTPVNLVDRSKFRYQLLIGRSYLDPEFVIDSSLKNTSKPVCANDKVALETDWLPAVEGEEGKRIGVKVTSVAADDRGGNTTIELMVPVDDPNGYDEIQVIDKADGKTMRQTRLFEWIKDHDSGDYGLRVHLKRFPDTEFRVRLIEEAED